MDAFTGANSHQIGQKLIQYSCFIGKCVWYMYLKIENCCLKTCIKHLLICTLRIYHINLTFKCVLGMHVCVKETRCICFVRLGRTVHVYEHQDIWQSKIKTQNLKKRKSLLILMPINLGIWFFLNTTNIAWCDWYKIKIISLIMDQVESDVIITIRYVNYYEICYVFSITSLACVPLFIF